MKKIIIVIFMSLFMTGCFEEVQFVDSITYTTLYPIKYATDYLYGDYTDVYSIYPNETVIKDYSLTDKQKNNYSDSEKFVYSGIAKEGTIAKDFLNLNNSLQIIDATKGMNITYNVAELWLDPSNYLMLARNIKESLIDYNDNVYIAKDVEEKYNELKEMISELDVMLYNLGKNGDYNTLLVSNNLFSYLNKYSINTISLDPNADNLDRSFTTAKNMITLNEIKYIYVLRGEELSENIKKLIEETGIEKIEITALDNLSNEEANNNEDYISLMKKLIDEYKKELYK